MRPAQLTCAQPWPQTAPARPGAAAAAAAEDAAGYAAQTAYGGELKGAYSAAGASSPRADPAPSPDAPAPPRWPDAPGYGAPAAVVHAPLVGARHAYEPAAELVPAVAEVEAAANGDAHTAAHDESAPHAEHVQPPQFETQLRHEHEAPRHPEAHASQERQQRRTEAAEEQPRPAPTRAGYGMPLGRRYNGEAAEAEVVQPEADEPREHQEQEPALKSESEREQEAVPEPEQRPAAAYDEPQQQGMEASPAAEAEEGAEPEEAEEPDEAAEPEDEAEAAGSTPPSPTPLSPSALSPQQRAGWQPFCPAPRPFTNPLGSSKGSLMGLVAPNPKAEVVRATDVIEEVRGLAAGSRGGSGWVRVGAWGAGFRPHGRAALRRCTPVPQPAPRAAPLKIPPGARPLLPCVRHVQAAEERV